MGNVIASLLFLTSLTSTTLGAKILMLPASVNSHMEYFGQLAIGLAHENNDVTIIAPTNARMPKVLSAEKDISVHRYPAEEKQFATLPELTEVLIKQALSKSIWEKFGLLLQFVPLIGLNEKDCSHLINNTQLMKQISDAKFDFVVVDILPCLITIPYALDIPFGIFAIANRDLLYRVPMFHSQVPTVIMPFSDRMDFWTRLTNFIMDIAIYPFNMPMNEDFVKKLAPGKRSLAANELIQAANLLLWLYDPVVGYPRPMMPNTLFIGDIMARPAKPLSSNLEKFILDAKHGVVLVSFGSIMTSLPQNYAEIFFKAFGRLKQKVLMKKSGYTPDQVPPNIKLMNWLPQNDILAHSNLKLFVSHCGLNSVIEAVSHGKPILAIPMFGDQFHNAHIVKAKNVGRHLELTTLTADILQENIEEIIANPSYTENMIRLSKAFHDKMDSPGARASHMINHVVKHGDSHLRTKAFDLYLFQFLMWDVYMFLLLCFIFISSIFSFSMRWVILVVYSRCTKKSKTKEA